MLKHEKSILNTLIIAIIVQLVVLITFETTNSYANNKIVLSEARNLVENAQEILIEHMSSTNQKIAKNIKIFVSIDKDPSHVRAFVSPNGRKHIEVSIGYLLILHQLVEAALIEEVYKSPGFFLSFAFYTASAYNAPSPAPAYVFGGLNPKQRDFFWSNNKIGISIEGIKFAAVSHMLAHEFAHHLLHHKLGNLSNEKSRQQELAADQFANKLLVKASLPPFAGFYNLIYWYYLQDQEPHLERLSTHPSSAKRMAIFANDSLSSMDKFDTSGNPEINQQKVVDALTKLNSYIKINPSSGKIEPKGGWHAPGKSVSNSLGSTPKWMDYFQYLQQE